MKKEIKTKSLVSLNKGSSYLYLLFIVINLHLVYIILFLNLAIKDKNENKQINYFEKKKPF